MFVTTLNAIDEAINQSPQIVERYEQQINETRQLYQQASQPAKKYELAFQLYELNKSFMNDSAIYYLNEAERWAEKMGNKALAGNCCAEPCTSPYGSSQPPWKRNGSTMTNAKMKIDQYQDVR